MDSPGEVGDDTNGEDESGGGEVNPAGTNEDDEAGANEEDYTGDNENDDTGDYEDVPRGAAPLPLKAWRAE